MNRRDFIRQSLLCGAGAASLLGPAGHLGLLQAATRAQNLGKGSAPFRALICIYLYGGNDSFNTLVPRDAGTHAVYSASRGGNLTISLADAQALPLNPLAAPVGGGEYGLHPGMQGLQQLFNTGRCAVVSNVGTLNYPITKLEFQNGSVPTPPQLFSHNDQTLYWQTSWPDSTEKTGWAGRAIDTLYSGGFPALSPCISLDGANTLLVGRDVQPYFMGTDGTESVYFTEGEWNQPRRTSFDALRQMARSSGGHLMEDHYGRIMQRSIDTNAVVSAALDATPALTTTFPDTWLGRQLAMVARMIAARGPLGLSQEVFFVTDHGYDTHDTQLGAQAELLPNLSACMRAFYDATVEMGVQNDVTQFTASDFGRTVTVNGDGTDHGWGGHHFVVGGSVVGRRYYGRMPNLQNGGPDDAAWGQIIPTTAVDQYAGTLARWLGVSDTNVRDIVVPNLERFGAGSPYLGFLPT
ncbi:DUF1501 domain-containing protein [Pseudomarimonas arenosa]|uniref:DUF1501 domain-containing protein n=1 Tax=Pseudomarimonas arenosa TaxID=2774145 RepID=A0AAW3ZHL2_9GAMM|nr:DUF1501 domain-containing protein [Pseudomarimonas arenosa]MBD8525585.1 DUF1501 domain-containing protein [Pseudomarimonas arenosa]